MTGRDWERVLLAAPRITVGSLTLEKEREAVDRFGVRSITFACRCTSVRIVVWPTRAAMIEMRRNDEFVYGCHVDDTQEALERFEAYLAAREQVRKAGAA